MTEQLGPMLVRLRQRKGYSQVRVAEGLCAASGVTTVTRSEISRWERQERIPSAFWLRWLAEALEVPVAELEAAAATARREARPPASAPTATGSATPVPSKGQTTAPTRRRAQQETGTVNAQPVRSNGSASLSRVTIEFEHKATSVRLSATYDDPRRSVSAIGVFRSMVRDSEPVGPEPTKVRVTPRQAGTGAAESDAQDGTAQPATPATSVVQQRRPSAALTASKPAGVPMGIRYTRGPEMR
jgi:transcriptional regulator with XRE-family HTH domain